MRAHASPSQTASPAPAGVVKGRRSRTARGAPVTRTELIRRCVALDSGCVWSAGPRSCSLSRATRRNHAAPDEGNRHPQRRSAHSLFTACGGRLCSLGENGQSPLLTPASHQNGREQTKPVWGSLIKVRPTWARRETARLHFFAPGSATSTTSRASMRSSASRAHSWVVSASMPATIAAPMRGRCGR